jgi:hypothetical protein
MIPLLLLTTLYLNNITTTIVIDPGKNGESFFYKSFCLPGALGGTQLNGQTISLDFVFTNNRKASAKKNEIYLSIFQDNPLGKSPGEYFAITGYLIDNFGKKAQELFTLENISIGPAQIWPNTQYYLRDGKEYLPAQTGYSVILKGTVQNYSTDPLRYSGIHFDIKLPNIPSRRIIGLNLTIANYSDYDKVKNTWRNPIYITQ